MMYIYNCFAGTHSSALAAAYHLKKIPHDRKPTKEEILEIDIFNKLTPGDFGRLIYHGQDEEGHKVYTIGRGKSKELIPALKNLLEILDKDGKVQEKLFFQTPRRQSRWP